MGKVFVIKDEDGNYLSSNSIFPIGNILYYVVHTGRSVDGGLDYCLTYQSAEILKCKLEKRLLKFNLHKKLFIQEYIDKYTIPEGIILKIRC